MSQPESVIAPGQTWDGYDLIRFLGRGGFGEVWLCRAESTCTYHAIKFISARDPELLEKERHSLMLYRNAAGQLRSPHLVPIEHINRHEAELFYVMPLADGVTSIDPADPAWQPLSLAAMIDARASAADWFTSKQIIGMICPILEALQTLSDAGLVHRDVKPENILFFNGTPCLGDISLLGEDAAHITRRGTPGYATPSWYRNGLPDMYGAAATLFILLTGNSPDKMGRAAFLWPPQGELSLNQSEREEWKRLHAIIRRATEEQVSERFVDFRSMAVAITARGATILPSSAKPVGRPPRQLKRKSMPAVLMVVLAIIGLVVLVFVNRSGSRHSEPSPSALPAAEISPAPDAPFLSQPKIVGSQGYFTSLRERVIGAIPAAIAVAPSDKALRLDIGDYSDRSNIVKAYQAREYDKCLELLTTRMEKQPLLLKNPMCLLFQALLFKQLERSDEMQDALKIFRKLNDDGLSTFGSGSANLRMRLTLLEALDLHQEAHDIVSMTIEKSRAQVTQNGQQAAREDVLSVMLFYRDRARVRILMGDMAGALADEHAALELPSGTVPGGSPETPQEARQVYLNTVVMEWELLEHEFPAYADYLQKNGSPEPKPDHRNQKAKD